MLKYTYSLYSELSKPRTSRAAPTKQTGSDANQHLNSSAYPSARVKIMSEINNNNTHPRNISIDDIVLDNQVLQTNLRSQMLQLAKYRARCQSVNKYAIKQVEYQQNIQSIQQLDDEVKLSMIKNLQFCSKLRNTKQYSRNARPKYKNDKLFEFESIDNLLQRHGDVLKNQQNTNLQVQTKLQIQKCYKQKQRKDSFFHQNQNKYQVNHQQKINPKQKQNENNTLQKQTIKAKESKNQVNRINNLNNLQDRITRALSCHQPHRLI